VKGDPFILFGEIVLFLPLSRLIKEIRRGVEVKNLEKL
jgi:hypothetical protein